MSQPYPHGFPDSIALWNNLKRVRWTEEKKLRSRYNYKIFRASVTGRVIVAKYGKISCIVLKVEFYPYNRN